MMIFEDDGVDDENEEAYEINQSLAKAKAKAKAKGKKQGRITKKHGYHSPDSPTHFLGKWIPRARSSLFRTAGLGMAAPLSYC